MFEITKINGYEDLKRIAAQSNNEWRGAIFRHIPTKVLRYIEFNENVLQSYIDRRSDIELLLIVSSSKVIPLEDVDLERFCEVFLAEARQRKV